MEEGGKFWINKMKLVADEWEYKIQYYERMKNMKPYEHPGLLFSLFPLPPKKKRRVFIIIIISFQRLVKIVSSIINGEKH